MITNTTTFGLLPDGREAKLFTFKTPNGLSVSISNYGGIITSIKAPDKQGDTDEICAGFSNLDDYLKGHPHFGVIVGRYANRISKGRFTINGKVYTLPINNGPNHLHGGDNGFHTKLWDYKTEKHEAFANVILSYKSVHLEAGYPGNIEVTVIYSIHDNNRLDIKFFAKTDAPTHVNLTSHSYFNLSGFKEDILKHKLKIRATKYLEVDDNQIPTGNFIQIKNTPYDFTDFSYVGNNLSKIPEGIDHCYVLNEKKLPNEPAATLLHEKTGRKLTVFCTQPGLQVYTANSLDGNLKGHNNTHYQKHSAICLEMQHFPDSPNNPTFPSTLLTPESTYEESASLIFGIKDEQR
ncbi:MAG: aldose epimerase family protein [Bacteroidales bacterium]